MKISFIDRDKLIQLAENTKVPTKDELNKILEKSLDLKGLSLEETAKLLQVGNEALPQLLETAKKIKETIYGKRLVMFAPLYTGNKCSNNCLYCGFRVGNKDLKRVILNQDEIREDVEALVKEGHKRLLMLCGESKANSLDYFIEAIRTAYSVKVNGNSIRRINVEIAPLEVEEFRRLKDEKIGTYACFQETYDPVLYKKYHPSGPKADYKYRLDVMDRAMEGGVDDVGVGVLFGLAPYKFEVLALLEHANHLENKFGCGPHTISVPRIEPAADAPLTQDIPFPVNDDEFKQIIAVLRIALPYTGIILSTREKEELRNELFEYGISQISAGSKTNPGAYSDHDDSGSQFSLGDHRSLDEVISEITEKGYVPSFCTGCYRMGRTGQDFMDLAKPGLIHKYCLPNGVFTFKEYLQDFASEETKIKGEKAIKDIVKNLDSEELVNKVEKSLDEIEKGKRDIYY